MSKRSLRSVLKIRQTSLTRAKAILADAVESEQVASRAETTTTRLIQEEISMASDAAADDLRVEMLAAWLPQARALQAVAAERHRVAAAATVRARAEVAAARASEAAVEEIIRAKEDAENLLAERKINAALNEHILNRQGGNDALAAPPPPSE